MSASRIADRGNGQAADAVIVVVGLTSDDEGEYIPQWDSGCGGDRSNLQLKQADLELVIAAAGLNPRTIVVARRWSSHHHPWDLRLPRYSCLDPGMEGGRALAEILFGEFNPCGRLPLTIPRTMDQLPYFVKDEREVTYDYFMLFLVDRIPPSIVSLRIWLELYHVHILQHADRRECVVGF